MLIYEILNEDLGNLAQLNAGSLINILKQTGGSSVRRGNNHIYTGKIEKKFQGRYGPATEIGSTSVVTDFIPLKDGFKTLRLAFKKGEDTGNDPRAFAIYINQQCVAVGAFDYDSMRSINKIGRAAYDFSAFAAEIKKADDEENAKKQPWRVKSETGVTSYHEKEPSIHKYGKSDEEYAAALEKAKKNPDRYQGAVMSTGAFIQLMDKIEKVAGMVGGKISAKLVYIDKGAQEKRKQRYSNKPEDFSVKDFAADLKTRLAVYKNSKKPSVDTIEQFIEASLKYPGKSVQFAGSTYNLTAGSYDKIDPIALLRGQSFKTKYNAIDPGTHNSLYLTYSFDKDTNQLIPIKAEWSDEREEDYGSRSKEAVLDAKGYLRAELGTTKLDKASVIKALLEKFKAGYHKKVLVLIDALKKFGADWPELDAIIKSANAEIEAKKKGAK